MMNFFNRYRTVLTGIVIIGVAFVVFSAFFRNPDTPALTETPVSSTQDPIDQQLIALLLTLHSITLNTALFDDPKFKSLKDFGRELVPEPVGRPNPFAPLTP